MRVLFATCPNKSVLPYLVPLAWALRTAGHEVRVASQPAFAAEITQAGLTAVPVGRDHSVWQAFGVGRAEHAALRMGALEPYDAADQPPEYVTAESLEAGYRWTVTWWHKMENAPMISELVAFAQHWQPELVLWEPTCYAGPIAARAVGAAHARLLYGLDLFGTARDHYLRLRGPQAEDPLADWLSAWAGKYGAEFSEDMTTGHFTVDQLPASVQTQADLHYLPMRYVPHSGPAVVPKWLWAPAERPRVAVTLGLSTIAQFGGYVVGVQEMVDALADLDLEIIATLAPEEQPNLHRVPDNVRLVSGVPPHALIPTCAAVIHHAGPGMLPTAIGHGIPQLALPCDFDEPALARTLAARGAGLHLHSSQATGASIRQGLLRLLDDQSFKDSAARLSAEAQAMPSPNQLVAPLEELTAKYRTAH